MNIPAPTPAPIGLDADPKASPADALSTALTNAGILAITDKSGLMLVNGVIIKPTPDGFVWTPKGGQRTSSTDDAGIQSIVDYFTGAEQTAQLAAAAKYDADQATAAAAQAQKESDAAASLAQNASALTKVTDARGLKQINGPSGLVLTSGPGVSLTVNSAGIRYRVDLLTGADVDPALVGALLDAIAALGGTPGGKDPAQAIGPKPPVLA